MIIPKCNYTVLTMDLKEVKNLSSRIWSVQNENLWIGRVPIEEFDTDSKEYLNKRMLNYFTNNLFNFSIEKLNVNTNENVDVELTAKTVYLLKEYLRDGDFKDPLCAHYNPLLQKNIIHPGGTRQIVLDLFHTGKIKTFYFNTKGHRPKFLNHLTLIDNLDETSSYCIALVPDHGTLIPHILNHESGVEKLPRAMTDAHNHIKERFSNKKFKIKSNCYLDYFQNYLTTKNNANVNIFFKEKQFNLKSKLKAAYLVMAGANYNNKDIKVVHK